MFSFDKMITPSIITIVYRIFISLSILGGLVTIFSGGISLWQLFITLLGVVVSIL
ncbi:TPA: DUF4282 domain-containing protein, partial [Proteus mirabilis]